MLSNDVSLVERNDLSQRYEHFSDPATHHRYLDLNQNDGYKSEKLIKR